MAGGEHVFEEMLGKGLERQDQRARPAASGPESAASERAARAIAAP